jgi:hypothetical protein
VFSAFVFHYLSFSFFLFILLLLFPIATHLLYGLSLILWINNHHPLNVCWSLNRLHLDIIALLSNVLPYSSCSQLVILVPTRVSISASMHPMRSPSSIHSILFQIFSQSSHFVSFAPCSLVCVPCQDSIPVHCTLSYYTYTSASCLSPTSFW